MQFYILCVVIGVTLLWMLIQIILLKVCSKSLYNKVSIVKNSAFNDLIRCQVVKSYKRILLEGLDELEEINKNNVRVMINKKANDMLISFNGIKKD